MGSTVSERSPWRIFDPKLAWTPKSTIQMSAGYAASAPLVSVVMFGLLVARWIGHNRPRQSQGTRSSSRRLPIVAWMHSHAGPEDEGNMTITLTMPPETQRKLVERAARAGQNVESLACELIERSLNDEPTLDEILAPFRRQVAASGLSESELTALFEESRDEVDRAQQEARR